MSATAKIDNYRKPIKTKKRGGREPSELSVQLMAALLESAEADMGKVWRGAAIDYKRNGLRIRRLAHNLGLRCTVGFDDDDLTFKVTGRTATATTATAATAPAKKATARRRS